MSVDYKAAVEKTFVKSLKSVFLVDDSFPTYDDMFKGEDAIKGFAEWERARKLYSAFRDTHHLPCDIENSFKQGDLEMVDRLRKCDLIVIDYHLDPGSIDNSKSIEILRRLADSPHFNTVIVYTSAELQDVWRDIAVNLRPDLRADYLLKDDDKETVWWLENDIKNFKEPDIDAIPQFVRGGFAGVARDVRTAICTEVSEKGGKGKGNVGKMAEIFFRAFLDKRRPATIKKYDEEDSQGPRTLQGKFGKGKPHWLQSRGCFIAIVKKTEDKDEVGALMGGLNEALLDWKPNFLQILVSEIQNSLELDSVATDPKVFSDANRQVGLSHYLMEQLSADEDPESAVESVVDRIVETMRHRIAADFEMRKFATGVLADVMKTLGGRIKVGPKLATSEKLANASVLAHVDVPADANGVISFLNAFLSTEGFAKSRITTGTVFAKDGQYWMVATPACDLTSRAPTDRQAWMKTIHPTRALLAIRLEKEDPALALTEATQGRHAFVVHNGETLSLAVLDRTTSSPDAEMFFVLDAGKVTHSGDKLVFRAARVGLSDAAVRLGEDAEYVVVGQLRPNYASRVLQMTGAHLSRIGVDFFNVKDDENE